jgi:hypothetical protein
MPKKFKEIKSAVVILTPKAKEMTQVALDYYNNWLAASPKGADAYFTKMNIFDIAALGLSYDKYLKLKQKMKLSESDFNTLKNKIQKINLAKADMDLFKEKIKHDTHACHEAIGYLVENTDLDIFEANVEIEKISNGQKSSYLLNDIKFQEIVNDLHNRDISVLSAHYSAHPQRLLAAWQLVEEHNLPVHVALDVVQLLKGYQQKAASKNIGVDEILADLGVDHQHELTTENSIEDSTEAEAPTEAPKAIQTNPPTSLIDLIAKSTPSPATPANTLPRVTEQTNSLNSNVYNSLETGGMIALVGIVACTLYKRFSRNTLFGSARKRKDSDVDLEAQYNTTLTL